MKQPFDVFSWNLKDGINDPAVHTAAIEHGFDVAVFPEAASEAEGVSTQTSRRFTNEGYELLYRDYNDADGRLDRHVLAVAVKPELLRDSRPVALSGRTALLLSLENGVDFMGVHMDDRRESTRNAQARDAVHQLGPDGVFAGDLNAMHRTDSAAKTIRLATPFANVLPARDPGQTMSKLQRVGSLSQRLVQMANGATMALLEDAGLHDAAKEHGATMHIGPLGVELDHILYRGNVDVYKQTVVHPANGLSDHAAISAVLKI